MEEENIQNEQLNQVNNSTSNEKMPNNQADSQNRGPFHNANGVNNASLVNRLNMLRNQKEAYHNNLHLFDKVNQRKSMPPASRRTRKEAQQEGEETKENTSGENGILQQNKSKKKKGLLDKEIIEQEEVEGEGSRFINSLLGKKKNEDPVNKSLKLAVKVAFSTAITPMVAIISGVLMLILLILIVPMLIFSLFKPIVSVAANIGFGADSITYTGDKQEEREFVNRLNEVVQEYDSMDRETAASVITAVAAVINAHNTSYEYSDMTKDEMRQVADMMLDTKEDGSKVYNADSFKQKLASSFLPKYFKGKTEAEYAKYAEEVYDYLDGYASLFYDSDMSVDAGTINQCSYDLTKTNYEHGKEIASGIKPSNIKVRLMQSGTCGGTYGKPLAGEELVDFEKYVLGVAYAEIGDIEQEEAFKAQLVVARSFALVNAVAMKRNSLKQENGNWIMEITNCNADQYYCDPDKGCSWDATSGNRHAISGTDGPQLYKNPLPTNAPQRSWALDVMGKVALDTNGRVFWTDFTNSTQEKMKSLAASGMDYTSILVNIYKENGFSMISDGNCQNVSTGIYSTWKQNNPVWANVVLGGGTDMDKSIGKIGCLATSLAILIQKSGVLLMEPTPNLVDSATFTPGTFVSALNKVNGFNSKGELSSYLKVTDVVPKFVFYSSTSLAGKTKEEKLNIIKENVNSGLYCVVQVLDGSTDGTHFVAIDYVDSQDNIKMIDPGAIDYGTDMWQGYDWHQTSKIHCYQIK